MANHGRPNGQQNEVDRRLSEAAKRLVEDLKKSESEIDDNKTHGEEE